MFRFAQPGYFYLFALIPLLVLAFAAFLVWRRKALQRFGSWPFIRSLMPEESVAKMITKLVLLCTALALLVLAIANPQTGSKIEKVKRTGIDLIIALDVSNSMLAQDIKPDRLERAKQAISRLIDQLDGDRIGIIVFAGKAYKQLPITTDYAAAKLFASSISTDIVPTQGTNIAAAIQMAEESFGETKGNKALIIITDGEDFAGNTLEEAEAAVKKGIAIYTIGIGSPEGAPIPVIVDGRQTGFKQDEQGNPVVTKLDETLLQRLAALGNGAYVRATNSEIGLKTIFNNLNKIQETDIEAKQFTDYESSFQYFVGLVLIILLLDLFIFEKKTQWWKRVKPF